MTTIKAPADSQTTIGEHVAIWVSTRQGARTRYWINRVAAPLDPASDRYTSYGVRHSGQGEDNTHSEFVGWGITTGWTDWYEYAGDSYAGSNDPASRPTRAPDSVLVRMDDTRYYATAEVAAELGKSPRTVRQLAEAHHLGECIGGRVWRFTRTDIEALRAIRIGRPRKSAATVQ